MNHDQQGADCTEHRPAHSTFRWKQFVKNSYSDLSLAELQACAEKLIHHNLEGDTLDAVLELLRAKHASLLAEAHAPAQRLAAYHAELDKKLPEAPPGGHITELLAEARRQSPAIERIALALERIENRLDSTPTAAPGQMEWYYPPPQSSSAPLQADHMTI